MATIRAVTASLSAVACVLSSPMCLPAKLLPPARADDAPQRVFNNACRTCHTIRAGDNRLGPNLFEIVGRKAGSLPNYDYSSAMKNAGFVWDEAKLARFVASPDEVVPGNKMQPYGGLGSEDTEKVIAFLRSTRPR
jgi:cytochrome c